MKKLLILLLFISIHSFGQNFYIEKIEAPVAIEPGLEASIYYVISNKLIALDKDIKIKKNKEESTYSPGRKGIGHIEFLDSNTNEEVLRSSTEKAMRSPFQGMKNPLELMFDRIVTNQFPTLLRQLKDM
jgi:hypothetical protein